jgi:hypothetical protein
VLQNTRVRATEAGDVSDGADGETDKVEEEEEGREGVEEEKEEEAEEEGMARVPVVGSLARLGIVSAACGEKDANSCVLR